MLTIHFDGCLNQVEVKSLNHTRKLFSIYKENLIGQLMIPIWL